MCEAKCEMNVQGPLFEMIKNYQMVTALNLLSTRPRATAWVLHPQAGPVLRLFP